MGEPTLTKDISDVRDKLAHFKSEDYAKWGDIDSNPLAEAVRICYVAHVQLLLNVIDTSPGKPIKLEIWKEPKPYVPNSYGWKMSTAVFRTQRYVCVGRLRSQRRPESYNLEEKPTYVRVMYGSCGDVNLCVVDDEGHLVNGGTIAILNKGGLCRCGFFSAEYGFPVDDSGRIRSI